MVCRRELLDSISPDMRLTNDFFLKIYGYELTWQGFAETALTRLERAGCSRAREYYTCIVAQYRYNHEKEMRRVAEWYKKQSDKKGDDRSWKKAQEAEQMKADLLKKKKRLLEMRLQTSTGN